MSDGTAKLYQVLNNFLTLSVRWKMPAILRYKQNNNGVFTQISFYLNYRACFLRREYLLFVGNIYVF